MIETVKRRLEKLKDKLEVAAIILSTRCKHRPPGLSTSRAHRTREMMILHHRNRKLRQASVDPWYFVAPNRSKDLGNCLRNWDYC